MLLRGALAWTLVLFLLNLAWEFAQLPLYSLGPYEGWPRSAYAVLHCTVGDAGIAFASYVAAFALTRRPDWPLRRPLAGLGIAVIASLAYTIWAEWRNVYVLGNWAYARAMPTLGGIGLAPLMQWIALPTLALLYLRWRRHRSLSGHV
ncbi:MAG: hypothetical protein IT493_04325 [Gammaproteobacteria bacterium]|nr:hypothetical protein [Gammaproteobacteria bacterium]